MAAVETKAVKVVAECGAELQINVPVGSLVPPTAYGEALFRACQDPRNWKYPVRPWSTQDRSLAEQFAYACDWYAGGHEWSEAPGCGGTIYTVQSRGYYHYIGA